MRTLIAISFFAFFFGGSALACPGADDERYHFPSCVIPLPEADEKVTIVHGRGPSELSSHHLGEPKKRTKLVTIQIAENNSKNYLVLSAYEQTIWRFIGDVRKVSKAIVLGATGIGPDGAGVIGLPKDRVIFTSPDLAALSSVGQTSCTRMFKACTPAQWFGEGMGFGFWFHERPSFHPEPTQPRQRNVDFDLRYLSQGTKSGGTISIVMTKASGTIVKIDPHLVVSRNHPQPYEVLPGRPGLEKLVESGALLPANSDDNKHIVQTYGETLSKRYRSRFDPDFLLIPSVDYIVTKKITLPAELPPTALLVARGVSAPEMNGNSGHSVCLFFEDQASKPARGNRFNSNLCRVNIISRAVPRDERDIINAAANFDKLEIASQGCRVTSNGEDAHVAAIALSEGKFSRNRNDPIRKIDVVVKRNEPTVLYLSMEGGPVQWNVVGSQVIAVYARGLAISGLTEVLLNGSPYQYTPLRSSIKSCRNFAPLWPNRLGPAIAQLDEWFEQHTAQRIDQLITFTETGRAWRDKRAPVPAYVVE